MWRGFSGGTVTATVMMYVGNCTAAFANTNGGAIPANTAYYRPRDTRRT